MKVKTIQIGPFKGLNNVSDPVTLGDDVLVVANNVNITDGSAITVREGYTLVDVADYEAIMSTKDYLHCYAQRNSAIVRINEDQSTTFLCNLQSNIPVRFMEINKEVYFSNEIDSGIIKADGVYDWNWIMPEMPNCLTNANSGVMDEGNFQVLVTHILEDGRETGASPSFIGFSGKDDSLTITGLTPWVSGVLSVLVYVKPPKSVVFQLLGEATSDVMTWSGDANQLGAEILDEFNSPLPGSFIDFVLWKGRVAWMQYNQQHNTTYIWFSEPLIYHQFQNETYLAFPGKGCCLAAHDDALVIGMEDRLLAYDMEGPIKELAGFGAVPGYGVVADKDGTMLMWTQRGWVSFFPFVKLMEGQVSVPHASYVGATMFERDGAKRVVAIVKPDGSPFNIRT